MKQAGFLAAACALAACATVDVPERAAGARPLASTDEGGIWAAMDDAEERARTSSVLNRDPELNAYVKELVCRIAENYCADVRVYVLDRPYFNASMAPNGYMEVWSGLLLRADNEAQVAFVIGHEVGHFVENHSLEQWRTARSATAAATVFAIGTAVVGVPVGELGQLAALSHLYGFSRDKEREADAKGFERVVALGYDAGEAAHIWRNLTAETEASDFEKVRKGETHASIFNTHPVTAERIEMLETAAAEVGTGGATGEARFRDAVSPHLDQWLRDDLRRRDFGSSLALIARLMEHGRDLGVLNYYLGEAYRLRHDDGDGPRAREAYEAAVGHPDAPAKAWRELGDALARDGEATEARAAYLAYLDRAPDAEDRLIIEQTVETLTEETSS